MSPTASDRARTFAALGARLPTGALGHHQPPAAPAAASGGGLGWPALSAIAAGLIASAGVAVFVLRAPNKPAPAAAPPAPSVLASSETNTAPSPSPANTPPAAPSADAALSAASAPATPPAARVNSRRSSDRLAEEVAILSRAETDLHAGRFAKALALLDEHARTFPRGTLAQERIGAQVQALCGLGRRADAESALRRLTPGSLQEAHAREACGFKN